MKKFLISLAPALAVAMFALVPSTAMATEHNPKGAFAPFKFCPTSNPAVVSCTIAETKSGEFTVGKRTVPITKTITLQGGLSETETGLEFHAAENGETLTKVALYVPGGLFNIVAPEQLNKEQKERFEKFVNEGITGVTATTELAQPASAIKLNPEALIGAQGIALQLPVKIKLGNLFLGSSCYIGTEANPVILNLTTGTTNPPEPNKPITGKVGTFESLEGGQLLTLTGGSLVDNAWAAPGASGCGGKALEGIVDPAVNAELGLPAAAGHNTAILNGDFKLASAKAVKASE
jgi:hypothetical protein